jgi:hypothetical protein
MPAGLMVAQTAAVPGTTTSETSVWGLPLAGAVKPAGSDPASAAFQKEVLPEIVSVLNTNLSERTVLKDQSSYTLDPSKLTLATESTARVYFVGEGAGYSNTLGFNTLVEGTGAPKTAVTSGSEIIFPNASSSVSSYDPAQTVKRTTSNPLLPGDFVDLGKFDGGTTLDFFLIANGANGGKTAFAASGTRNPDRIDHAVSFALPGSPYLILAFEDLYGGGDRDFNDVAFAVDIGRANVDQLVGAPEPETWAILTGFIVILIAVERRKRQRGAQAV